MNRSRFAALAVLFVANLAVALPAETTKVDGTAQATMRAGQERQTVTADITGKYAEATRLGQTFTVTTAALGVTVAASHVSPLTAATGTPILALYNPIGSGKNLEVLRVNAAWISGTLGAGGLVLNYAYSQTITSGCASIPAPNLLSSASSVARFCTNAATTGSTVGILLRPITGCSAFAGVVAATTTNLNCSEEFEGSVVIPPGGYFAIAAAAAGTSPIVQASITYREATP